MLIDARSGKMGVHIDFFHRICLTLESSFGKLRKVEGNRAGVSRDYSVLSLSICVI